MKLCEINGNFSARLMKRKWNKLFFGGKIYFATEPIFLLFLCRIREGIRTRKTFVFMVWRAERKDQM